MPKFLVLVLRLLIVAALTSACATTATVERSAEPASSAQLQRAKVQVQDATSLRYEVFSAIDVEMFELGSRTEPFITGSVHGDKTSSRMDMASLLGPLALMAGGDSDALAVRVITEADVLYVSTPMFAADTFAAGGGDDLDWASQIATGWGRIDSSQVGDDFSALADLGLVSDPTGTRILDVLDSAGEVRDGGSSEVRGVATSIALADVSMAELMQYTSTATESALSWGGPSELDDVTVNLEVHVDDAGLIRRIEFTFDTSAMLGGSDIGEGSFEMWQRVDYFDFGSAVAIDIPTDAVDITADIEALLETDG